MSESTVRFQIFLPPLFYRSAITHSLGINNWAKSGNKNDKQQNSSNMILYASPPSSIIFSKRNAPQQATPRRPSPSNCAHQSSPEAPKTVPPFPRLFCHNHSCLCGRRRFIEAAATSLLPLCPSMASSNSSSDYTVRIFFRSRLMGFSPLNQ